MTKGKELKGIEKVVLKDGNTYKIEFTMNALIELEEKFGSVENAFKQMEKKVGLKEVRLLAYAGLVEHHDLTEKEVGRLIDLSKVEELFEAISKAMQYGLPNAEGK